MAGQRDASHLVEGAFGTWMVTAVCRCNSHQSHTPQTCTGRPTGLLMPSVTGLQVFEQALIGSGCVYVR